MRWIHVLLLAVLALCWPLESLADPSALDWAHERAEGHLLAGEILDENGALRIANMTSQPRRIIVLELDSPAIATPKWHLAGSLRHRDIKGHGYLELLAMTPSGNYAARTFSNAGPQARITGTSDWRPVWIPFDGSASGEIPDKLVLAVHLPGDSTVDLNDFSVREGLGSPASVTPGTWWGEKVATWVFGGAAAALLIFAVILGLVARRRTRRRLVLGSYRAVLGAAGVTLVLGIVAAILGQPTTVYFPLVLVGLLASGIYGFSYRSAQTDYEEAPT